MVSTGVLTVQCVGRGRRQAPTVKSWVEQRTEKWFILIALW